MREPIPTPANMLSFSTLFCSIMCCIYFTKYMKFLTKRASIKSIHKLNGKAPILKFKIKTELVNWFLHKSLISQCTTTFAKCKKFCQANHLILQLWMFNFTIKTATKHRRLSLFMQCFPLYSLLLALGNR
jgi:hypothetical protein